MPKCIAHRADGRRCLKYACIGSSYCNSHICNPTVHVTLASMPIEEETDSASTSSSIDREDYLDTLADEIKRLDIGDLEEVVVRLLGNNPQNNIKKLSIVMGMMQNLKDQEVKKVLVNHHKEWTYEDDYELMSMYRRRFGMEDMQAQLKRTAAAINMRISKLLKERFIRNGARRTVEDFR